MRDILFRGKRIDNGEWIAGSPWIFSPPVKMAVIIYGMGLIGEDDDVTRYCASYEVIPESISEFTGLTDKNGKKIFEGDICKFREWDNGEMCWIGYVHFEHCQFIISGGANKECPSNFYLVLSRFSSENIEVIGNIYDNPELLEV